MQLGNGPTEILSVPGWPPINAREAEATSPTLSWAPLVEFSSHSARSMKSMVGYPYRMWRQIGCCLLNVLIFFTTSSLPDSTSPLYDQDTLFGAILNTHFIDRLGYSGMLLTRQHEQEHFRIVALTTQDLGMLCKLRHRIIAGYRIERLPTVEVCIQ
jgi:hypothetical protein